jgi:hypothetical protein
MEPKRRAAGIAQEVSGVVVLVAVVRVEHEVELMDFTKWLERPGGRNAM